MFDCRNFDDVFDFNTEFEYDPSVVESIEKNRRNLQGLFVDKVLTLSGIKKPSSVYPPRSNSDLKALHQAIINGNTAEHTKLSLLYYVLLDCIADAYSDFLDNFENRASLPRSYQIFIRGLWHMDQMQFETALQHLTHPSLIPTFPEEIIATLVKHSKRGDFSLALAYYHSVQPRLQRSNATEDLFTALAETNITEAYLFCAAQPIGPHRLLFETLVATVLRGKSSSATASRATELINLPLTAIEEGWFEKYLASGDGKSLPKAKDTLLMRRLVIGDFSQALSVKELDGKHVGGLSWSTMQRNVSNGLGPRK